VVVVDVGRVAASRADRATEEGDQAVSGPYVERIEEPGEALLARVVYVLRDEPFGVGAEGVAQDVLDAINPHLAALVAAAEERGRVEGAAKERERIADLIDAEADTPHLPTAQRAYLRTAARIARRGAS